MQNVPRPLFMTLCRQRACVDAPDELPPMGSLSRVTFSDIVVDNSTGTKDSGIFITGLPGHCLRDITIRNLRMCVSGGGMAEDVSRTELPEYTPDVLADRWPEFSLVGTLPAYGIFFARHVLGLLLTEIHVSTAEADARPCIVLEDVTATATAGDQAL